MADKKPRIRKTETVRQRTEKSTAKAEAKASKQPKRPVRRVVKKVTSPFKKPARFITAPFRTRPFRAVGRYLKNIFWFKYFRNSYREVKQVTWPTRKETIKLTFAVLIFAAVFGLVAAGVDQVLDSIIRRIIFRA